MSTATTEPAPDTGQSESKFAKTQRMAAVSRQDLGERKFAEADPARP